jgi:hypothetical protein
LRAIAVGDDQFVAVSDTRDLFGSDADVAALIIGSHRLATTKQGVAAQGYDDSHD